MKEEEDDEGTTLNVTVRYSTKVNNNRTICIMIPYLVQHYYYDSEHSDGSRSVHHILCISIPNTLHI